MTQHLRRKHRLVLNVTFDKTVTEKQACQLIDGLLCSAPDRHILGITKISRPQSFNRVVASFKATINRLFV